MTYLIDPSFADVDSACANKAVPAAVCAPRNALPETTLYVPLQFWFCRNPGLALPLIALQYHEVRINLELRPSDECLFAVTSLAGADGKSVKDSASYQKSLVAASLYVDYVFLDTDERRRMAQNPHEYLIEQLQFTGDESVGSSSNKIKLNFNHPCKELVWVVQPDANVDYCASFLSGQNLNRALGAQPFNYTDALDALTNTIAAFSGPMGVYADKEGKANGNAAFIGDGGLFQDGAADTLSGPVFQWGQPIKSGSNAVGINPLMVTLLTSQQLAQQQTTLFLSLLMEMHSLTLVSLMLALSSLPRLPSTCTAGDRTLLSPLSSSLTVRIASLSVRVPTSTLFSLTSTTHVTQTLVSMSTHSHSALRSTSHLVLAT